MRRSKRAPIKEHWDAFNEASAIQAVLILAITAVGLFAGKYDYISVLEYWTLVAVCTACAVYIGKNARAFKMSKPKD